MNTIPVTFACSEYDHISDLLTGAVKVDGISLNCLSLSTEEIFFRTTRFKEFDLAEMSFARYVAMRAAGDTDLIALPVFPSRMFRQSAIFVGAESSLVEPGDLAGKRIGIPEWAQTAGVYVRGWLSEDIGIDLHRVRWFQSGVNQPGREETLQLSIAGDYDITPVRDRSLTQMLLDGDIDAMIAAHPPALYEQGDPRIRPLIDNTLDMEIQWYQQTGIYPVMHLLVVHQRVLDAHPWVAMSLYKGFTQALRNSLARMETLNASRVPIPWAHDAVARAKRVFGKNGFSYGVEENRATLESFLRYCTDQGLCENPVTVDSLFAPQTLQTHKV